MQELMTRALGARSSTPRWIPRRTSRELTRAKAPTPERGDKLAEASLSDGSALASFLKMVDAQGGDTSIFENPSAFHKPGATQVLEAWTSGYIGAMDTMEIGWAVQRTGAGRERAGEPVDPHAGIEFLARRGARVEKGQPLAKLYATSAAHLAEPVAKLKAAISIVDEQPVEQPPLVSRIFTREDAEEYLANAAKVEKNRDRH